MTELAARRRTTIAAQRAGANFATPVARVDGDGGSAHAPPSSVVGVLGAARGARAQLVRARRRAGTDLIVECPPGPLGLVFDDPAPPAERHALVVVGGPVVVNVRASAPAAVAAAVRVGDVVVGLDTDDWTDDDVPATAAALANRLRVHAQRRAPPRALRLWRPRRPSDTLSTLVRDDDVSTSIGGGDDMCTDGTFSDNRSHDSVVGPSHVAPQPAPSSQTGPCAGDVSSESQTPSRRLLFASSDTEAHVHWPHHLEAPAPAASQDGGTD